MPHSREAVTSGFGRKIFRLKAEATTELPQRVPVRRTGVMKTVWRAAGRVLRIVSVATRHLALHGVTRIALRYPRAMGWIRMPTRSGPVRLRMALEELGGSFIKFGQMLSLQPDVLSLEYCNALYDLLDRITPLPFADVEQTVLEELGRAPSEIFDRFDSNPLATASIGQVHVAYAGTRKLAVKVQRPRAAEEFGADVRMMAAVADAIERFGVTPLYWLLEPIREFVGWTLDELDYRHEARCIRQLRRNAAGNPREQVPDVHWQYTTARVLVMDFLDGTTALAHLRAVDGSAQPGPAVVPAFDTELFSRHIIDNFLADAFTHGMFHADLHPANLMAMRDGSVGYVDFGITGFLSQYCRHNLLGMTLALARGDLEQMCVFFYRIATVGSDSDLEAFRKGLRVIADDWYHTQEGGRRLRCGITRVMLEMLQLSRRTHVWPDRDAIKFIRSAIAIDSLVRRIAPAFDVGVYLESGCERHVRAEMSQLLSRQDAFVDLFVGLEELACDGPMKIAATARRSTRRELRVRDWRSARRCDPLPAAVQLAILFCASLLMVQHGADAEVGANLFTAAALVAAVSFGNFVWSAPPSR